LNLKTYSPGGNDMTATLTSLFELAGSHGFGVAILLVGAQVLLDRLMPVEHLFAHLFGARKSTPGHGTHRREREPQPSAVSRFASTLARDRNEPIGCMK